MKITINRQRVQVFLWIGLAYLAIWVLQDAINSPDTFFPRLANNIWLVGFLLVVNFLFYEYALPQIRPTWDRILLLPVLILFMLLICTFGIYTWRQIGIGFHIYTPLRVHDSVMKGVAYHAPYAIMSIFFFGITRHVYLYRQLQRAAQRLRLEKQEAELNYLKSQTNPHFLFNTLNNIYALARDKSDLAPESILRLSKILRYMLYEAGGDFISIDQELKIIADYIALEQLRYDESLRVNFHHDIEDMKQAVPPLLLVPLVENAFKHGVSETRSHPFVEIRAAVSNRQLTFMVKNSSEATDDAPVKENIGLSNLRRQLQLLYSEYELTVLHSGSVFTATLKINLASHV